MRRPKVAAVLSVALGLALAACGADGAANGGSAATRPSSTTAPDGGLDGLSAAVCDAARQARAGDADTAEATFFDQAHEAVHELARRLEQVDRGRAAAVLEAKQRVEAGFDRQPTGPGLGRDLDALARVVGDGLARLELPAPACAK